MSDSEQFLSRWSRMKREAEEPPENSAGLDRPAGGDRAGEDRQDENRKVAARTPTNAAPEEAFDATKLPSLDSIDAKADVTAFLKPGVPLDLRNAALRRAWAADPAIRNFVGLQEYDWDFASADIPGFGEIGADVDVQEMVARLFGETPHRNVDASETNTPPASERVEDKPRQLTDESAKQSDRAGAEAADSETDELRTSDKKQFSVAAADDGILQREENVAKQQNDSESETAHQNIKRHGSALPR